MILVHISKNGVERIQVQAACEREQDLDLRVWPLVRQSLRQLDRKLQRQKEDAPEDPRAA